MGHREETCSDSLDDSSCSHNELEDSKMQAKQCDGTVSFAAEPAKTDQSSQTLLQKRLATVKIAISNQSSSTRTNLAGRFKVN